MIGVGWGSNQFVPLLLVYRHTLHLGEADLALVFALYAVGLAPGFLIGGPAADRYGRRPLVIAFTLLSVVASAVLVGGHWTPAALAVGRLLTGASAGVVFSVGTTWVKELSTEGAARRTAISLSAGFGAGALAGGLLGQWAPAPDVLPHVVHMVLVGATVLPLLGVPETLRTRGGPIALRVPAAVRGRFAARVVPVAPWVFTCATIAFTVLPARVPQPGPLATGILSVLVIGAGIAVQPLARRLESRPGRAARWGLATATLGLAVAALAARTGAWPAVTVAVVVLGAAYGQLLVAGLRQVERLADPDSLATLVALFYVLAYCGVFAPYAIALLASATGYPLALALAILPALAVLAWISRATRTSAPRPR